MSKRSFEYEPTDDDEEGSVVPALLGKDDDSPIEDATYYQAKADATKAKIELKQVEGEFDSLKEVADLKASFEAREATLILREAQAHKLKSDNIALVEELSGWRKREASLEKREQLTSDTSASLEVDREALAQYEKKLESQYRDDLSGIAYALRYLQFIAMRWNISQELRDYLQNADSEQYEVFVKATETQPSEERSFDNAR